VCRGRATFDPAFDGCVCGGTGLVPAAWVDSSPASRADVVTIVMLTLIGCAAWAFVITLIAGGC
jgi:hypothetical protein